ncbi:uncharacterized protein BO66DRAFT_436276 [Aspergillus aculeatinus CBS 121060]|uniref:Uncharacterized protein n=1 Tax=Aspergillus aculeatinus CBS 121060 TaxID=1448322 RepID=A0ACD1HGA6_9EURO|nr:hypothetical protein BO66DRAFT_436276 [Aspergillus aculeatinus CBS 121060]RAH72610.1 hypothetical protein BO66DRAFT_436276 [Aspergillus aculeatinus CBS 121060]
MSFFIGQPEKSINELVKWTNGQHLTSVRDIWQNTVGTAYLIFPHDKTPAMTGIFYSVELPETIAHGNVEIVWIN